MPRCESWLEVAKNCKSQWHGPARGFPAGFLFPSGDFVQINDCPTALAARKACFISMSFKPSAAGIRSGSVSIIDDRAASPQTLSLAGSGLALP